MNTVGHARWVVVLSGLTLVLSGCGSLPGTSDGRSESLIDREGVDVVAADAGRQLTYFKDQGARERFCRAPTPDFARTAGSGTSVGVPTLGGGSVGVGNNLSKGSLDLGGRDPVVLITRELLYRACELATNINADPTVEREIYGRFLSAVVEIAKSHLGTGSSPLASEPNPAPLNVVVPNQSPMRRPSDSGRNPHDSDDDDR